MPGRFRGRGVASAVHEAVGEHAAGLLSDAELAEMEAVACPAPARCGGQYTANTMSMMMEAIGLSPVGSDSCRPRTRASPAAPSDWRAGDAGILEADLRPSARC